MGATDHGAREGGVHGVGAAQAERAERLEQVRAAARNGRISRLLARVLADVAAERAAQDTQWGVQDHPDGSGPEYAERAEATRRAALEAGKAGALTWRHVLAEEVDEALAESAPSPLRAELIQVAAVAVAWVEALDRRNGRSPHPIRRGGPAEKLVRDRIPELIEEAGGRPAVRTADQSEHRAFLKAKLYEEAGEYAASGDPEELADLLEVVRALARTHALDPAELDRIRAAKAVERGGFDKRLVLLSPDQPSAEPPAPTRHSARALVLDGDELILFRRVKPGREPFWTTPGGGVEPTDRDPEAALRRELHEELGAVVGPLRQVFAYAEQNPLAGYLHTFYLCRLLSARPEHRHGPEFADPARGRFEIDRVPCTAAAIARLNLLPEALADFLRLHVADLPGMASDPGTTRDTALS